MLTRFQVDAPSLTAEHMEAWCHNTDGIAAVPGILKCCSTETKSKIDEAVVRSSIDVISRKFDVRKQLVCPKD